jgi:uncharacterized protein (TIGR04255 family)
MAINEVFPNPTVRNVIFQIIFPNLFYMEQKIGEFQLKIMKEFPESVLLQRQQILLADLGPNTKIQDLPERPGQDSGSRIWQFKSPKRYDLNVMNNSLDINSQYHKTYDNAASEVKFRDLISFVLKSFFDVVRVPIVQRVGLRYIDDCPIPAKNNAAFLEYYNSTFPTDRFPIEHAEEMEFKTVVRREDYSLRFAEALRHDGSKYTLVLDFDGFAINVDPQRVLETTDKLHTLIIAEYENSIRQPVIDFMRRKE